jgi:hypothetical protein
MIDIYCEPDDDSPDTPDWYSLERLADPDSVERLELWLQVRELGHGQ